MPELVLDAALASSMLARAIAFQGDAVRVLLSAEQKEVQTQWAHDAGESAVPALLLLAQQHTKTARQVCVAWTNTVQAILASGSAALPPVAPVESERAEEPVTPDDQTHLDFDLDLDEPDGAEWSSAPEVWNAPDRLSQRERARSFAQTLALRHDWAEGIDALTDVLDRPRWGQIHLSIERLIRQGMTPTEFELAYGLREVFQERPELNVTPCRTLYRSVFASAALRWSVALDLARAFPGHDPELLVNRLVSVCQRHAPEHRFSCWSDRLSLLLDGFPLQVDGDYWLTVLEER